MATQFKWPKRHITQDQQTRKSQMRSRDNFACQSHVHNHRITFHQIRETAKQTTGCVHHQNIL